MTLNTINGVVKLVSLRGEGRVNHVRACYVLALHVKKKKYIDEPMWSNVMPMSNHMNK